ncbi:HD domain-containing protein, partial [Candidatus Poribacteria bacterium]|nr:HD domain-containing protein [Candidatus Poribacteria bacterium]
MDIRDQIKTDSHYYQVYQKIKEVAQTELPNIQKMFPYYTGHGIPHCDRLFELIGEIISDNVSLTPFESLLLGGAVFLHDIGMAPRDGESPTEAMQKEIRDNHHHRATEYILENYGDWGLDEKQAQIVAEISLAHRGRDKKDILEYPAERTVGIGAKNKVRMHLLCALLRIADECHVTYDRVESLMKHENQLDEESRKHFLKHLSTEGISCSPKGEILEISATITKNEVREILEGVQKKIEYELDGVRDIFQRYGIGIRAVRVHLHESESLKFENQGTFDNFVMKLLENDSLQISNFMKVANIGSAAFQHLLKMLEEREVTIEEKGDSVSWELDSDNLMAVSRIFLDSPSKMKFIQLDAVQQAIEKSLASIIRRRFYIEIDEATLRRILGFAKRLLSVLHFLLVSDNLYYANVFKHSNQFEQPNLSNLTSSRFISEILTAALKDLRTLPPGDLKEL